MKAAEHGDSLLLAAPMVIIMLLVMRSMFRNDTLNMGLNAGAAARGPAGSGGGRLRIPATSDT